MRKLLIIQFLVLISTISFAQSKPDTAKKQPKETFRLDLSKPIPVEFKLTIPASVLNNYFLFENVGPDRIDHATDITALTATTIKANHKEVADSLKSVVERSFYKFAKAQQDKFTADTTAKYHPVIKKTH